MSLFKIAADLIRGAFGSSESEQEAVESVPVLPTDVRGLLEVINRHRMEIDGNFQVVAQQIAAQNSRHARALQVQKRWNYALTAAVVILAVTVGVLVYKLKAQ